MLRGDRGPSFAVICITALKDKEDENGLMKITTSVKKFSSPETEEMIVSFLQNHPQGVLTTIEEYGSLQSSVVTTHMLEGYHLAFMTKFETRKFKNIENNPIISFMTFDQFSRTELEIEGVAQAVRNKKEEKEILDTIKRNKEGGSWHISPYVSEDDNYVLFIIYPKKAHMTTYWEKPTGVDAYHEFIEFDLKMKP